MSSSRAKRWSLGGPRPAAAAISLVLVLLALPAIAQSNDPTQSDEAPVNSNKRSVVKESEAACGKDVEYPAALTRLGLTGWKLVFNPDLTKPVEKLIGPDAVNTPLTWDWPWGGTIGPWAYGTNVNSDNEQQYFSTSEDGLVIHYQSDTQGNWFGGRISSMDQNGNGRAWTSPVFFEVQYEAPWLLGTFATFYTMSKEGTFNRAQYNLGEFDVIEQTPDSYTQTLAQWTAHKDTAGQGPAGPDEQNNPNDFVMTSTPSLYGHLVTWQGLWGDGTHNTPKATYWFLNNSSVDTYNFPLYSTWTGEHFWFDLYDATGAFSTPSVPGLWGPPLSYDFRVKAIRIWQPADVVN